METTVRELLRRKGTSVVTTSPSATVYRCIQTMVDHNVGAILGPAIGGLLMAAWPASLRNGTICDASSFRDEPRRRRWSGRS